MTYVRDFELISIAQTVFSTNTEVRIPFPTYTAAMSFRSRIYAKRRDAERDTERRRIKNLPSDPIATNDALILNNVEYGVEKAAGDRTAGVLIIRPKGRWVSSVLAQQSGEVFDAIRKSAAELRKNYLTDQGGPSGSDETTFKSLTESQEDAITGYLGPRGPSPFSKQPQADPQEPTFRERTITQDEDELDVKQNPDKPFNYGIDEESDQ